MQILLGSIIGSLFFILNGKILLYDIRNKKIPNKLLVYLLILLPFWIIYGLHYGNIPYIHIAPFMLKLLFSFLTTFLLFHFGVWGAGDAKYLLILSLFIPQISIITLILCIAISIISYLTLHFIWFWTGRNIFTKKSNIYKILWNSKTEEIKQKYSHLSRQKLILKSLSGIIFFTLIFIIERLLRVYIFEYLKSHYDISLLEIFHYMIGSDIAIILIFIMIIISFYTFLFIFKTIHVLQQEIGNLTKIIFILGLLIILIFLSYTDITNNPEKIIQKITLISTISLSIYIGIKLLWLSYKITFHTQETEFIKLYKLRAGMVIDKNDLIKTFRSENIYENKEKGYLIKLIRDIKNPLNKNGCKKIKKIYKKVDAYHIKNKTPGYVKMDIIKIIKTFALSPYILLGFILAICNIPRVISDIIISFLSVSL